MIKKQKNFIFLYYYINFFQISLNSSNVVIRLHFVLLGYVTIRFIFGFKKFSQKTCEITHVIDGFSIA